LVVTPPSTNPPLFPYTTLFRSTSFAIGSFSDVGVNDNPWSVSVDWGDTGSTLFSTPTQGTLPNKSHTYDDNGTYTVTVTVMDKSSEEHTSVLKFRVHNVCPRLI